MAKHAKKADHLQLVRPYSDVDPKRSLKALSPLSPDGWVPSHKGHREGGLLAGPAAGHSAAAAPEQTSAAATNTATQTRATPTADPSDNTIPR